mgnify:CR=1 FL=1
MSDENTENNTDEEVTEEYDAESIKVSEVMSQPLFTIESEESLEAAREMLSEKSVRHLTVTQNNEVVGILSIKDL